MATSRTRVLAAIVLGLLVTATAHAADLSLTKVRLRRNSSGQGDNSGARVQGFFVAAPPGDVFDATNGVTVRIQDAIGTDQTVVFADVDCLPKGSKTTCLAGGYKYVQLQVKPSAKVPEAFQFALKVRKLGLAGPFDGPVAVTLTETGSGVDRVGTITDCVLKVTGIACRAF